MGASLRSAVLLLALAAGRLGAQASVAAPAVPDAATARADVARLLERVRRDPTALPLPPADSISIGGRVVPAGTVAGRVAIVRGTLEVAGTVDGDAIVIDGTLIVRAGGRVTGNAFAAPGQVQVDAGGIVEGEIRTLGGAIGAYPVVAAPLARPKTTLGALQLALAWLALLLVLGLGVLVLAGEYLDGVLDTLERNMGRSLLIGIAGQLAIAPALLTLVVALAITIVGLLLVPFAIVAYGIAVAGLFSIGFLAVAQLTGHAVARRPAGASARGVSLRALVIGILVYVGFWILAAALTAQPQLAQVFRWLAFGVTWVVATAGFGAALLSRGGTRRVTAPVVARTLPADDYAWQTPTPVSGIAAARRPTPAPPMRTGTGA